MKRTCQHQSRHFLGKKTPKYQASFLGNKQVIIMVQQFSLHWNNFESAISDGLAACQQNAEFVDMTIAADGHLVKVHQLIISIASPYLKELILSAPCPHPVIHLNGITYKTLSAILEYIYTGEVTVSSDDVPSFFEAAKGLAVKGLQHMSNLNNTIDQNPTTSSNVKIADVPSSIPLKATNIVFKAGPQNPLEEPANKRRKTKTEENPVISEEALSKLKLQQVQYSISNRGSLQLILNRYIYNVTNKSKTNRIRWGCVYKRDRGCPAVACTQDGVIVSRTGVHNHPYDDKKILKKIEKNILYSSITEIPSANLDVLLNDTHDKTSEETSLS